MSDTVITMPDGSKWSPSTSVDVIQCSVCGDVVDTEEEAQAYADGGDCPHCGNPWVTKRSTTISVTSPAKISGGTM